MKKVACILVIAAGLVVLGFVLYVVGHLILIAAGVIHPFGKPSIDNMDDPEFRSMVERQIDVVFPETIQWQKSRHDPWLELSFYGKFRIPEEEVEPMIAHHKGEWFENDQSALPSSPSYLDWMDMDKIANFKVFVSITPGHHFYVVVDQDSRDEEDKMTVYLEFFDL